MTKILGIIPARYDSSRFPGKPLVVIEGITMIMRVYGQAMKCELLDKVIVATDNEAIFNHVELSGGKVLMTSGHHNSGTERSAEVVEVLAARGEIFDCVINIQGDEPFIDPRQIRQVGECFSDPDTGIATLVKKITDQDELLSPNVVKVVTDIFGNALLFSRSAIPFLRGRDQKEWISSATFLKHIGIYGYRTEVLKRLVALPPSRLELNESLEQLRWLEHGYRIKTQLTEYESVAIDTPADLSKITNTFGTFPR